MPFSLFNNSGESVPTSRVPLLACILGLGLIAVALLLPKSSHAAPHRGDSQGCRVCTDDCPPQIFYGDYYCLRADGSLNLEHPRTRLRRRPNGYMVAHRNEKTGRESTLRVSYQYPSQSREQRMAPSNPDNGKGRLNNSRVFTRGRRKYLDRETRRDMRGTMAYQGRTRSLTDRNHSVSVTSIEDTGVLQLQMGHGDDLYVHLAGIAMPRYNHVQHPDQCMGFEANAYLKQLLIGQTVTVDIQPLRDPVLGFQTERAYVYLDGYDTGALLLNAGYAMADATQEHRAVEQYERLQQDAQEAGRGMWNCRQVN